MRRHPPEGYRAERLALAWSEEAEEAAEEGVGGLSGTAPREEREPEASSQAEGVRPDSAKEGDWLRVGSGPMERSAPGAAPAGKSAGRGSGRIRPDATYEAS